MKDFRFEEMTRLKNSGLSNVEIGNKFNVSRERVRQIIGNRRGHDRLKYLIAEKKLASVPDETVLSLTVATRHLIGPNITWSAFKKRMSAIRRDIKPENCTRFMGQKGEKLVNELLSISGVEGKLMPTKHHWDIQLKNGIKIEVKTCFSPKVSCNCISPRWGFDIKANSSRIDYYAFLCYEPRQVFIVPVSEISHYGNKTNRIYICYPTTRPEISKYEKFRNAFHLLKDGATTGSLK